MSGCLQDHSSGFEAGFQHQKMSSSQPSPTAILFSSVLVAARDQPSSVSINSRLSRRVYGLSIAPSEADPTSLT
jgi:hypothetical protein